MGGRYGPFSAGSAIEPSVAPVCPASRREGDAMTATHVTAVAPSDTGVLDEVLDECWEQDRAIITQTMIHALGDPDDDVGSVVHYLPAKPGKLLRPQLVMTIARRLGCAPETVHRAHVAAAAVELLHLGSLYHDDVMDEASLRRGLESANARFSNLQAVLAGDIVLAASSTLAAGLGRTEYTLMADALAKLCRGQLLETLSLGRLDVTEAEYLGAIEGKTASLLGVAGTMACLQADADEAAMVEIKDALEALGLAFQMLDDLVDVIGLPGISGKAPGQDLQEGVVTIPLIRALDLDPSFAEPLRAVLGTTVTPGALGVLAEMVIRCGAAEDVLRRVRDAEERGRGMLAAHLGEAFAASIADRLLWTSVVRATLDARQLAGGVS